MALQPVTIFSGALNSRRTMYVYTPPGYEDSRDRYPVLYLLHGMYGGETDWIYHGKAVETIDGMISRGELPPTIVVFPNDGQYADGTFYVNWYDGSGNFEDYFLYDIVAAVDRTYRTSHSLWQRGIAGLSMGGLGAVLLAFRNPTVWGVTASLSGAFRAPMGEPAVFVAPKVGPVDGPYELAHNVFRLAELRLKDGNAPGLYFNCGTSDYLFDSNEAFHQHLHSIGFPHAYEEFSGDHTWDYWQTHLVDVCRFMSESFRKTVVGSEK